ncbi:MAG: hypothetical protein U5N85_01370 [Arcicella sp.]|nr:hypothetical protein [Arcicella sp.]
MKIDLEKDWKVFENGNTLGNQGSEEGIIISDFENVNGARITIEKDCRNIPFAITFGIYGVMAHTHTMKAILAYINEYLNQTVQKINEFIKFCNINEENRDDVWHNNFNIWMSELTD